MWKGFCAIREVLDVETICLHGTPGIFMPRRCRHMDHEEDQLLSHVDLTMLLVVSHPDLPWRDDLLMLMTLQCHGLFSLMTVLTYPTALASSGRRFS